MFQPDPVFQPAINMDPLMMDALSQYVVEPDIDPPMDGFQRNPETSIIGIWEDLKNRTSRRRFINTHPDQIYRI